MRVQRDTWPLGFSPDSHTIATSSDEAITLWDAEAGSIRTSWTAGKLLGYGAFSPDGRTFAAPVTAGAGAGTICVYDTATGQPTISWRAKCNWVYGLAFIDSGRRLRARLGDETDGRTIITWDVKTGQQTSSLVWLSGAKTAGCDTVISPDNRLLAVVPMLERIVTIWDVETGRELTKLRTSLHAKRVGRGMAFSDDSRTLVIGRFGGSFEIWDVPSGQLKKELPGHTDDYMSHEIHLAPDGKTLVSRGEYMAPSSHLGAVKLAASRMISGKTWRPPSEVIVVEIETGLRLARTMGATRPLYSPDSATIATYESDRSVRLRPNPDRAK